MSTERFMHPLYKDTALVTQYEGITKFENTKLEQLANNDPHEYNVLFSNEDSSISTYCKLLQFKHPFETFVKNYEYSYGIIILNNFNEPEAIDETFFKFWWIGRSLSNIREIILLYVCPVTLFMFDIVVE